MNDSVLLFYNMYIYTHILIICLCFLPSIYLSCSDKSIEIILFKCKSIVSYLGCKTLQDLQQTLLTILKYIIHSQLCMG